MKKYLIITLLIVLALGMLQSVQAEENEAFLMQLPSFKISIMGIEVDNLHNKNPLLVYNGVTYIPLTSEYSGVLLFETEWSHEKGLIISSSQKPGLLIQDRSVNNEEVLFYNAVKPKFDVYLNGRLINNDNSQYPILVYNSVTYFPLIQEYLDKDFDIAIKWNPEYGFAITSKTNKEVLNNTDLSNVSLDNKTIEKTIRDILGKPQGILTQADLSYIQMLNLSNKGLTNLKGIEYLKNVKELYLDNNNLEEINNLKSLTNLKVLHLQRNFISDISPLANLTNLEELSLNGNRISSLQPLSGLVNLQKLYFTENNITDINPLKNLVNLNSLYMKYGNKIRNYKPIASYYENITKNDLGFTKDEFQSMLAASSKPLLSIPELIEESKHRKINKLKLNGYYAISSNDQYEDFKKDKSITAFDSMSFGWAFVDYDSQSNISFVNMSSSVNEFHIPDGYEDPVDYMKRNEIETNINIYASRNYDALFTNSDKLIDQIITLLSGKNKRYNGLTFNGVVIDFENLPTDYRDNYVEFLHKLDNELTKYNKNLIVAVSPLGSYDFAKIVEIADNVILMLHDYDMKSSNSLAVVNEKVDNPNTPIEKVKGDLINILNEIDRDKYMSKLLLQINFSINQCKVSNGVIINQVPYTPKYEDLIKRIKSEIKSGKDIENVIGYSQLYQNPYIIYTEAGVTNSIWYEDDRSVSAKIQLAKDLGLGGISLWRIGNIPDYSSHMYLDTWNLIRKLND